MSEMLATDDRRFLTIVEQWLRESTDLIVERESSNLPNGHALYLINSKQELSSLIEHCRSGDYITVVRGEQLPIRGCVNEELIAGAEQTLNPDLPFTVMTSSRNPARLIEIASGTSLRVLRRTLLDVIGKEVLVGQAIQFVAFDDITQRDEGKFLFGRKLAA